MTGGYTLSRRSLFRGAVAAAAAARAARAANELPNIVFLLSDDHTAFDLGCYGNTAVHTPHLDRLAGEGTRFRNCFVASPQCSPNRSAIFTGCTPHTTATSRLHTPMPDWELTFLEPLKERGYFVGALRKVHQGAPFDRRWDFYARAGTPFDKFFAALPKGKPFFLHVGFTDPHRPYKPGAFSPPHDPANVIVPRFLPDAVEVRADLAHYYDFIARMDAECGQILDILRKRNLEQNTLVIFTGDNGMPFPRAKGTCYDPGIHVSLLARWPGRLAAGGVNDDLVSHVDLPVTWLDMAGVDKPAKMQGRSLFARDYQPRSAVFAERNWHDNFDPIRAVRTARYKLIFNAAPHYPYRPAWDIEDSPSWQHILRASRSGLDPHHKLMLEPTRPVLELYDLEQDPHEFQNLIDSPAHLEVRQDLERRLSRWMHDTLDFLPPGDRGPNDPPGRSWPVAL